MTDRMTDERLDELQNTSKFLVIDGDTLAELFAELRRARAAEPVDPAGVGPVEARDEMRDLVVIRATVRRCADDAESLCHWRQDRGGAREQSHWAFHYGNPCPYEVAAAVLRGEPDPRVAQTEPNQCPPSVGRSDSDEAERQELAAAVIETALGTVNWGVIGEPGNQMMASPREAAAHVANSVWSVMAAEVARCRGAVEHLRELHKPERCVTGGGTDQRCAECKNTPITQHDIGWPCRTMRVLAAALGDGAEQPAQPSMCGHADAEGCTGHGDF